MVYCINCGVELDEKMNFCPLCGENSNQSTNKSTKKSTKKEPETNEMYPKFDRLSNKQRHKFFWELSGLILISEIIITALIDFIINKSITWSKYSITVSLVLMVNITLFTFLRQRQILLIILSFISTSILLVLLDLYNQNIGWGIQLGIPLLFSFYFWVILLMIVTKYTKQRGLNMLAYYFLAAGLFSLCIDGIIFLYQTGVFQLQWSIIVIVCIIPISAILLYIHYRLNKGIYLKRFFHL